MVGNRAKTLKVSQSYPFGNSKSEITYNYRRTTYEIWSLRNKGSRLFDLIWRCPLWAYTTLPWYIINWAINIVWILYFAPLVVNALSFDASLRNIPRIVFLIEAQDGSRKGIGRMTMISFFSFLSVMKKYRIWMCFNHFPQRFLENLSWHSLIDIIAMAHKEFCIPDGYRSISQNGWKKRLFE